MPISVPSTRSGPRRFRRFPWSSRILAPQGMVPAFCGPALALALLGIALTPAAFAQSPTALSRPASATPELEVSFEEAAVVASELTPGADAVFFSVAREPRGHFTRVVRSHGVEVVDALGEARFLPEDGAVPPKSAWVVVDLESGAFGVAAPEGFRLRPVAFPGRAFEAGAPGVVNRLRHVFPWVEMLLVRPGGTGGESGSDGQEEDGGGDAGMGTTPAAWRLAAWDTSPFDRDGEDDDAVVTAVEDMVPLEETGPSPPEEFAEGDVLVVIDPLELRVSSTRLLGPPETGGES